MYMLAASTPPAINTIISISNSTIRVNWTRPTMPNGIITIYTVTYVVDGSSNNESMNVPYNGEEVSTIIVHVNIDGLICNINRHNLMPSLDYLLIKWYQ